MDDCYLHGCGGNVRCTTPRSSSRLPTIGRLLSLSHFPDKSRPALFGKIRSTFHLLAGSSPPGVIYANKKSIFGHEN